MNENSYPTEQIIELAKNCGAYAVGLIATSELNVYPEVRDMCKMNTCRGYGASWACPPGVGTLEECLAKVKQYDTMLLFSCKYDLEDSFDYEGMIAGMEAFKKMANDFDKALKDKLHPYLLLANEGCQKCKTCTYPDAPCRFPDELHASIEAYGFNVSELAGMAGIKYINGTNTVTYFGALCFNQA